MDKTTSFRNIKGVPLRNAKRPFTITITREALLKGLKKRPDACVAALDIWGFDDQGESVRKQLKKGGRLFAVAVRKTSTHLGFQKGGKIDALRFHHYNGTRCRIRGFDEGSKRTFKVGQKITFYPPKVERPHPVREPSEKRHTGGTKRPCERRVIGDEQIIGKR